MKRIRIAGLCLVAVLALSLTATAAVQAAQPVFYGVAEVGKTVKAPIKIAGTLGAAFLEGKTSKAKISCTGGTSSGEIISPTETVNNVTAFTGCETAGLPCKSAGEPSGTIKTSPLEGVIGSVTATAPGLRLYAPGGKGKEPKTGTVAAFECGNGLVNVVVTGSVIGALSGAQGKTVEEGKFASSVKLTYAETAGKQKYEKFLAGECGGAGECGPEQLATTVNGTPELSGQSVIVTLKTVPFAAKLGYTK